MKVKENTEVQAKLTIANTNVRQLSAAIVVLAGLLSGFFWLGYWTAEMNSLSSRFPASAVIEKNQLTKPAQEAAPTPLEQLGIKPEDSVRL